MKTCTTYVMMAALAVAGFGMSVRAADVMTNTNPDNAGAQMQQTGSQMADESTAKDVRETLAKIVNDGVEKNKFNSFLSYLSKTDRDRVGEASKSNLDNLNAAIEQFRQDFKSKYNQNFDISAKNLQAAMAYAGQDKKSATVSFANPDQSSNQATTANPNNMAMASVTLNLINEGKILNEWRINSPQISLEQLKQNLTRHIQMLDDQKAAWPSDVNSAYQATAYHILQAFNDTTVASDR